MFTVIRIRKALRFNEEICGETPRVTEMAVCKTHLQVVENIFTLILLNMYQT